MPRFDSSLTEPCGIGRDDDVARQHHLDADRVGDACTTEITGLVVRL